MGARHVALLLAASLASACVFRQTRQARLYVLDPLPVEALVPADAPPPGPPEAPVVVVGVMKVTVPGWIDRPQITMRSATGQIVADEYARWGEPIARGIQRVLADDLASLLPDRRVVSAPFVPSVRVDERVEVTISEAARQPDGSFLLEARWAVLSRSGEALARGRSSQRTRPSAAGAGGTVAGMNETLAGLARELAQAIRGFPARQDAPDPAR